MSPKSLICALLVSIPLYFPSTASAQNSCAFEARGTSEPPSSGNPMVINLQTGTVISANFFDSGAIDPPFFDGQEFVSVCIHHPDQNGITKATITTDVGLDNDTRIKGYPQFVIGTKFGNLFETSYRYYPNTGLPADQQWPVTAENLNGGSDFNFANLEYVSQIRGVGLPAFTNSLPEMIITLDIDEQNVVGSERDVMLESWFYDTSANADLIGNGTATGQAVVSTLNNIVGIGHPHYAQLDNTLLEMMVHIGPLSPNDISGATRNPGQNQLTEVYSGKDFDGDGIDDHFDVDSHVNANNNLDPQPGVYSSGVDANNDGIDDADLLPVTIGDYQYSIWYGASFLAPIIIYSRETNSSLQNDFDPLTPDMDLSTEGEILLPWNDFIDYTLNTIEPDLQQRNQNEIASEVKRTLEWIDADETGANVFTKMRSTAGAISGIELGVEPQINSPADVPYSATVNKFDVAIDGNIFSLNDTHSPTISIDNINTGSSVTTISGTATDNVAVDRNQLLVRNIATGDYWNGTAWTNTWSWFSPVGTGNWTYDINLTDGEYTTTAWTWDSSNNLGDIVSEDFSISASDITPPTVNFDSFALNTPGPITISGISTDNIAVDRNKLLVRDLDSGEYWNGSSWTADWSWFDPTGIDNWSHVLTLPAGDYRTTAWAWDTSNNLDIDTADFIVNPEDNTAPIVAINPVGAQTSGSVVISGTSSDTTAIDRNKLLILNLDSGDYWNGSSWTTDWSWFDPTGINNWSHSLTLPAGNFRTIAWTWDTSNNLDIDTADFAVTNADTTAPTVNIVGPTATSQVSTGDVFIYLSSSDETAIDRNRLLVRNLQTGLYWNGANWVTDWSWFTPGSGTLEDAYEAMLIIDTGLYELIAWTWDSSNNVSNYDREVITVSF